MYTLQLDGRVIRNSDGASIPSSPSNRDYRKYIAWIARGNTPEQEQAADPEVEFDIEATAILNRKTNRVIFKALLKHENRLRTLEGLEPLTAAEYVVLAKESYSEEF